MRIILRVALVVALVHTFPIASSADSISDQKKAYKALGIGVSKPPAACGLLSKSEAAKYLGKAVHDGTSAGSVTGCAYRAMDGSNDGVLVTRQARSDWYPPSRSRAYKKIDGLGGPAYINFEDGIGYEAAVLLPNGVTNVQLSGKGSAATAVQLLRIAMKR